MKYLPLVVCALVALAFPACSTTKECKAMSCCAKGGAKTEKPSDCCAKGSGKGAKPKR